MKNKRQKEKITPENKKLILQAIAVFIGTIASLPIIYGLIFIGCLLAELY